MSIKYMSISDEAHRLSWYTALREYICGLGPDSRKSFSTCLSGCKQTPLNSLEINNIVLDQIQQEFEVIVRELGIKIHSFQEGRGMSGIRLGGLHNKVVDDESSRLGLASIETVETIDADHRKMVRCNHKSDPQYSAVYGVLRHFIRNEGLGGKIGGKRIEEVSAPTVPTPGMQPSDPWCEYILDNKQLLVHARAEMHSPVTDKMQPVLVPHLKNDAFIGRQPILERLK
ncbi:hypothetical protein B0H66DRAFT_530587 [Apodospora peruviana]|uniref:Uncharacterized protein n=1 Tax=Apodospora peruviana TaxID=516989 RepID=A0AAE0IKF7_9PEZI|nr:hypothetical protein B0H66DRAFT_530587 [Apodospora peruviana]